MFFRDLTLNCVNFQRSVSLVCTKMCPMILLSKSENNCARSSYLGAVIEFPRVTFQVRSLQIVFHMDTLSVQTLLCS